MTTVWSSAKWGCHRGRRGTWVKATGVVGMWRSCLRSAGLRAARASSWAVVEGFEVSLITDGEGGEAAYGAEELVLRGGPEGEGRRGEAEDGPGGDGLFPGAGAYLERGELFGFRTATGEEGEGFIRRGQEGFEKDFAVIIRASLRDIEGGCGVGCEACVDGALPGGFAVGDGEGLGLRLRLG